MSRLDPFVTNGRFPRVKKANLKNARIHAIFSKSKGIQAAFLFGSQAKGRSRKDSDTDIAILLLKMPGPEERVDIKVGLSEKLSKIFGSEVDVVIVNGAGSLLKYQITRDGKLLYERKEGVSKKFRLNAIKEYFDYLPTFKFHCERQG